MLRESSPTLFSAAPPEELPGTRAQWERITLAPDIELHIRRPLTRAANKQVDRLIDAARDILRED
jgi:hypothetical protein